MTEIFNLEYQDEWLDQYFCMDYFSKYTDIVQVREVQDVSRADHKVKQQTNF